MSEKNGEMANVLSEAEIRELVREVTDGALADRGKKNVQYTGATAILILHNDDLNGIYVKTAGKVRYASLIKSLIETTAHVLQKLLETGCSENTILALIRDIFQKLKMDSGRDGNA